MLHTWKPWALAAGAVLTLASSGCGSRDFIALCQDACDERADRGCPPDEGIARCKENCESIGRRLQRLADKGNCGGQLDALEACSDDNFDRTICTATSPCASEGNALTNCIATYCAANPGDGDCR